MSLRVLVIAITLMVTSCSTRKDAPSLARGETDQVHYSTLSFEKGEARLGADDKRALNELAVLAERDGRAISRIRVLAWADRESPRRKDAKLAEKRGELVKEYLVEELHSGTPVKVFNMAKSPGPVSRALGTEDWQVKEAYRRSGASSAVLPDGQTSYTKASKALVIIDFEDGQSI